jgi:hypothetical protein
MRAPLLALAAAVVLPACSSAPPDPVLALLAELEAAAEARDADRFAERLSPGFEGLHAIGRAEAVAQLRRYFAAYDTVALEVYGVETERDGASARVECVVELSGQARKAFGLEGLLPPQAVYRFSLDVVDEKAGAWRVERARWERVEGPG